DAGGGAVREAEGQASTIRPQASGLHDQASGLRPQASGLGEVRDLDAGLAGVRDGLALIALPARVAPAAAIVAAAEAQPVVAWSTEERTIVGIGVARELRASGPDRFAALVAAARALDFRPEARGLNPEA